jgi:glyoxylase-like metal-dependent hydrolase (beta-lactamase superfamily II)
MLHLDDNCARTLPRKQGGVQSGERGKGGPMTLRFLTLIGLCGIGCASPSTTTSAPKHSGPIEGVVRETGDPRVGAWVSSPWTFSTTSYWIEAPDGLILVDTQFLPKETIQFLEDAERTSGKKAKLAIVLHANPDKFNGTKALTERGIDVITSKQVRELIPSVHAKRVKAFGERYAPDYPLEEPAPRVFGDSTTTIEAAGTKLTLHVTGAGCSAAHVILEWEGNVFAGDLIANGAHSWLEIGETLEWKKRLDEIDAMKPKRVHPGRGLSGGPDLIAKERTYLDDVIAAVAAEKPTLPVDDGAIQRAKAAILKKYPELRFGVFLNIGLPAEFERQAREPGASPRAG